MSKILTDQEVKTAKLQIDDHTGTVAEAFFIANLLFVGIFYVFLWGLYFLAYKNATPISKHHLKQTLVAGGITTLIVILLNCICY